MKAVRFHQFGGPEVLKYEDVPDPVLRKDHVLVRVKACALNHLDLFIRKGLPGIKLPHINGSDISGEVVDKLVSDARATNKVSAQCACLKPNWTCWLVGDLVTKWCLWLPVVVHFPVVERDMSYIW